jgi:hypothetical protein
MTGNIPMVSTAPDPVGTGFFKPKGDTRTLRKASRLPIHRGEWPRRFFGRKPRIERGAVNHDAEGIAELRTGQQFASGCVGFNRLNLHRHPPSCATA